MKKKIGWTLLIFVPLLAFVYLYIPNTIQVSQSIVIASNTRAITRALSDTSRWSEWWPGQHDNATAGFNLGNNKYQVQALTGADIIMSIRHDRDEWPVSLLMIPVPTDSIKLQLSTAITSGANPFQRMTQYWLGGHLKENFSAVLQSIRTHYSNDQKIYGLDIRRESVVDTSLVFTIDSSLGYPTTKKIYSLIDELRSYMHQQNAAATDSPMLNLSTPDKLHYTIKVAIPSNKILPSSGKIHYRWMLPQGNILVASVQGNQHNIDKAFKVVEDYVHDYELTAPAIPFYKLITNRMLEKDSSRWITKIYYPVMFY